METGRNLSHFLFDLQHLRQMLEIDDQGKYFALKWFKICCWMQHTQLGSHLG